MAWLGRRGVAWRGGFWQGMARRVKAGMAWRGMVRRGSDWHGRLGLVRQGWAWLGSQGRRGSARLVEARHGLARPGVSSQGNVYLGEANGEGLVYSGPSPIFDLVMEDLQDSMAYALENERE